jgi:hypothetical protein
MPMYGSDSARRLGRPACGDAEVSPDDRVVADAIVRVTPEPAIAFAGSARPVSGVMLEFVWLRNLHRAEQETSAATKAEPEADAKAIRGSARIWRRAGFRPRHRGVPLCSRDAHPGPPPVEPREDAAAHVISAGMAVAIRRSGSPPNPAEYCCSSAPIEIAAAVADGWAGMRHDCVLTGSRGSNGELTRRRGTGAGTLPLPN